PGDRQARGRLRGRVGGGVEDAGRRPHGHLLLPDLSSPKVPRSIPAPPPPRSGAGSATSHHGVPARRGSHLSPTDRSRARGSCTRPPRRGGRMGAGTGRANPVWPARAGPRRRRTPPVTSAWPPKRPSDAADEDTIFVFRRSRFLVAYGLLVFAVATSGVATWKLAAEHR